VITEATNPQVRQVVKTFAHGFGLEIVEVPYEGGITDPERVRRHYGNIGLVAGPPAILDLDFKHGGTLEEVERDAGPIQIWSRGNRTGGTPAPLARQLSLPAFYRERL
jgi:glycine cleavage system pyridoxal-binding protein P